MWQGNNTAAALDDVASVAAEVDQWLSKNRQLPMRVPPDEWRSGNNLWLVDATCDSSVVRGLMKQLVWAVFAQWSMKVPRRCENGKQIVEIFKTAAQR